MDRTQRLIHPVVAGAIALLAVNDHVLKPRWPGPVTGKLSDMAGLFALAVVVAVLVGGGDHAEGSGHRRRSTSALAATGLAFAGLKLVPALATLAAPVLGGTTATDPTDLIALAVLYPAHRFVRSQRTPADPVRSQRTTADPVRSQRTAAAGGLQVLAATLALTAGTFSVTATSCIDAEGVAGFALVPDGVVAGLGRPGALGSADSDRYLSTDGGRTWAIYDPPALTAATPTLVAQQQICVDGTRCYRVVDNDRVEERDAEGAWHTAFTFTDEQIRRMRLRADSCSGRGEPEQQFASLTPTGPTSPSDPNLPTVLVSMGTQGVLRLDPESGRWERFAVGRAEPLSLRGPSWMADLSKLPLLFLLITPALYLVHRTRRPRRQRIVLAAVATVVAAAIGLAALGVLVVTFGAADYAVFGASVAALSITAFLVSLGVALRPPPRGDEAPAGR